MELLEQTFLVLAYIAVIGFLINGLDDLLFDSGFLLYLFRRRKKPHLKLQQLRLAPEQWIAIYVPAWQEGGIVNKMAEYASRVVLYEKYDIFIGVYPNDPETNQCVDQIVAVNPRIHKVVVPHDGPTSKSDCLNWIYRAMRANESPGVREYAVVAIHDAEDVIHPLVLKVYNHFVPREYDMAQLPVFALEHSIAKYWVANTYIDDFAELHTKDLFVRETIQGIVPSAGVGTAFSRAAIDRLASENEGQPFLLGNLTEDYEVAIRLKRVGYRAGFISYPVDRLVRRKQSDGSPGPPEIVTEIVGVRENFPTTFGAAVRQRSRWILGIAFQTWEQAGWKGTWPMRYTLARDRRAPLTHLLNMLGYLVLAYVLLQGAFRTMPWGENLYVRPLFTTDSTLWKITIIDTCLLAYRAVQKFISVALVYNVRQAFASIPRTVVNNLINFVATVRAARIYLSHKLFGHAIVWHKTEHVFPDEAELREYTKSIEDILVEEGFVTRQQIFDALGDENTGSTPARLLGMGLLDEKDFTAIWARHSRLPVHAVDPQKIATEWLRKIPERESLREGMLPLGNGEARVTFAFCEPPTETQLSSWRGALGLPVRPVLTTPSNLSLARCRRYPRTILPSSAFEEGLKALQEAAGATDALFLEAQVIAHRTGRSLPDTMVDLGMLSEPEARRVWAKLLSVPAADTLNATLNQDFYFRFGPVFWWLHRLVPLSTGIVLAAAPPHSEVKAKISPTPENAVLPSELDAVVARLGVTMDPDKVLAESLRAKGWLAPEASHLPIPRNVLSDPSSSWLVLKGAITETQAHEAFQQISGLPVIDEFSNTDVKRLAPVLAPYFSETHGAYCIREANGELTIGLTQMPSVRGLLELYDRLDGRPLLFVTLPLDQAEIIRTLLRS